MTDEARLRHIAYVARIRFGLTVWQWKPGHVGQHAPGSLHYQTFRDGTGRAFDIYGPRWREARFLRWLRRTGNDKHLTEGIFNGIVFKLSVKHGQRVPSSYWGAQTWAAHRNHIHIAV